MSRKTRKLIWSAPLVAVLAVAGALAIFAAQMPNVAFAAKPSAPTSLSATATSATQINLSWTAATVGGDDPAVSGYKIEVSTTGATSWSRLVENTRDTGTTYQDMGLEAGQRRHYRVSAINMDGTSTPSNIDNATTWSKPAAPTELAATADSSSGDTAINLTWVDVPTPTDGSTISAYQVEASRSSSGPWTVLDDDVSGGTQSYDHAGLMAGQTWHYQVSATNTVGTGAPATAMASTWKKPAAPAGFTAMPDSMAGNTTINLSWSKVSAPETGGDLDGSVPYKLFATTAGAEALRALEESAAVDIAADADTDKVGFQYDATGSVSGTTVAGGQTWHFQVAANNRAGIGDRSAVRVVKTWTLPGAPTGLMATAVSSTRVDLSWTAPTNTGGQGVKITGYLIERSTDSAATWPVNLQDTTTNADTTYADTNDAVKENDTVHYRVSAMNGITVNGDTAGMASNIALAGALDAPDAPTKLTAAAVSGTQIDLSWTAPKDPDEAPVTGYKIEFNTAAANAQIGVVWSVLVADTESTGTTHMDMTLMNGDLRHYQVSAINKAGTGDPSSSAMATAWKKSDAPTMDDATPDGPSRIKLSWQPPAAGTTGGMDADGDDIPITGYKIEVSDDLGVTWSVVQASYSGDADASAEGVQYIHIGLMAGDQRHYQVRAINAVGESDPSNIHQATTDADAVAPGAPTMVMATKDMDNPSSQINVSWMAPADTGGTMLSGYVLQRKSGDGAFMTIAASNVASWWNALDCPMMNDAIPADATPPPGADDPSSPYCKLYGGLTAEAKEEVNAAFMAADYGTITGTSYMDMGLERMTTYTYQVKAVNSAGASMWSETAMAMTGTGNAAPMAEGMIDPVTVAEGGMSEMDVSMYFSDAEGDTLTYTAMSDMEMYATAMIDGSMLTITGVAEGSATVTVTATDADGSGMSAEQEIMVTVTADTSLGPPTITSVTVDDEDPGSPNIDVAWDNGANALSHMVLLFSTPDYDLAKPVSTRQDDGMTTFNDVAAGTYAVVVVSYDANFDWQFVFATVTVDAGN